MIDKLRMLDEMLAQLNTEYRAVASELANLKSKPDNEPTYEATISNLNKKLSQNQYVFDTLQRDHQALEQRFNEQFQQINQLTEHNRRLILENNELKEKNRLAIERAETIQTWLYNIDNAQNS